MHAPEALVSQQSPAHVAWSSPVSQKPLPQDAITGPPEPALPVPTGPPEPAAPVPGWFPPPEPVPAASQSASSVDCSPPRAHADRVSGASDEGQKRKKQERLVAHGFASYVVRIHRE
jgi:hypothetical protein